jgi:acylpyruvate hydrolase
MSPLPIIFNHYASTLIGNGAAMLYPPVSHELDWEGELAVIVSRSRKGQIARKNALDHIIGHTAFNDVTVRNHQFCTAQYIAGQNFRASEPLGPIIVTTDEPSDPHDVSITTRVNGTVMQRDTTASIFSDVPFIFNHLSEVMDLGSSDVIAMGTSAGVGFKREPLICLQISDLGEVELSGVGILANRLIKDE